MPLSDEQHAAVDTFLGEYAPADAPLVKAILTAGEQSTGDPAAVSPKGARGLMQLTPDALIDTGRDPTTFDYDSPVESMKAGADYVRVLRDRYGLTNPLQIAAAYNAGPGQVKDAVAKGGIAYLPDETRGYVARMAAVLGPDAAPSARVLDPRRPPVTTALAGEGTRRMPLVTDALAGEGVPSRAEKAVDVPEAQALVYSDMARQRDQQPWYRALPERALEPLAELGIHTARTLTGSTLPPVPMHRLLGDVAQTTAFVPAPAAGRVASAAIQAGAGLAAGLQTAAERHGTTGGSWAEQVAALDPTDAVIIGTQVIAGGGMGALFPGRAVRPLSPWGALQRGKDDLDALMARTTAEQTLPAPRSGQVTAAFGRLDRNARIEATAWRNAVIQHGQTEGATIPSEVQAVMNRLEPEMTTKTVTQPGVQVHPLIPAPPQVTHVQVPTGRWFTAPIQPNPTGTGVIGGVGDLLDANMRLGNMVNTTEARAASAAMGHSTGNLNALRTALSGALADALPTGQRALYQIARGTSKEVAQANAGMRFLERYINPDEGLVNGAGLYKSLTEGGSEGASRREILQRRFGVENYRMLVDYARSISRITSTPEKVPALVRAIFHAGEIGAATGAYYAGGSKGVAAAVAGRVLYSLATSRQSLRLLDAMARAPVGSTAFAQATGRLALGRALLGQELQPPPPADAIDGLLTAGPAAAGAP